VSLQSRDFERADEILDEDGWCPDQARNIAGNVCTLVAIDMAMSERDATIMGVSHRVAGLMEIPVGAESKRPSIAEWNDTPGRTREDVHERLMLAAKKLRDKGR
jgi:hypothetical protein